MQESFIKVKGARTHNLRNISVDIPKNKFVVITGVSGSGKSSLAFDTIYAEGQRRYVESLSVYARQFLHMMDKPDVDHISGLSPAISINQKARSHNPRSTVGTVTEIHDYMRLLFARIGVPYSPSTGRPIEAQSIDQMVEKIVKLGEGAKFYVLAPVVREKKGEYKKELNEYKKQGFQRVIINGVLYDIDSLPALDGNEKNTIAIVVDRLIIPSDKMLEGAWRTRLVASLETTVKLTNGIIWIQQVTVQKNNAGSKTAEPRETKGKKPQHVAKIHHSDQLLILSEKFACPETGFSIEEIEPRLFSFNNPQGACTKCNGLGIEYKFDVYKIINWSLSLKQGAIICLTDDTASIYGLQRIRKYYQALIEAVAKMYGIPTTIPFSALSQEHKDIILNGTEETQIPMQVVTRNKVLHFNKPFEGVLNILNRRLNEVESNSAREKIAPLQTTCPCSKCLGRRLKPEALCVKINGRNIAEVSALSIFEASNWFKNLHLSPKDAKIGEKVIDEINNRLTFLKDVGLGYISLSRRSETLSGGESQRIRLASQIGSGLSGVLYVLDEPSIGLHQRDNDRLLQTIKRLRDLGNSVIVVEHDEDAIRQADWVIDIGPKAGICGGEVVASGELQDVMKAERSLTAAYLTGLKKITVPEIRRPINTALRHSAETSGGLWKATGMKAMKSMKRMRMAIQKVETPAWRGGAGDPAKWGNVPWLIAANVRVHNLKNVTARIPLGRFVCVTGVSGSGKSSLVLEGVFKNLEKKLRGEDIDHSNCGGISGVENINKIIDIDQSPIGRTPRSNPGTYVGCFSMIREWFASLPEAKARGYTHGRFSFNIKGGRCEACQGDGQLKIEMHFLPDVYVQCDQCRGKRYNKETLLIQYKNHNIADILDMSIDEGVVFFENQPSIWNKLKSLQDVGLGYLSIGHPATSLSGGEAQRIKLAKELCRKATGKTLYILDEPTTGLHFEDIRKLIEVLDKLVDQGNSVIIIEHNLDVIKVADWLIDLGPDGGDDGGTIVAEGTPEDVADNQHSITGRYLKPFLGKREGATRARRASASSL
ncbi:MAG: excinuclease ABC subunit UvrA [Holosporales bacterium]|jgi:excinuclease ABC subunit A|nr:excinuclease ABC subunit UvrA [Holosporales bacterium]